MMKIVVAMMVKMMVGGAGDDDCDGNDVDYFLCPSCSLPTEVQSLSRQLASAHGPV